MGTTPATPPTGGIVPSVPVGLDLSKINISFGTMPYEAFMIKFLDFTAKVMDTQPKEVQAELWKIYLEDLKNFRAVVMEPIVDFLKKLLKIPA